MMDDCISRQAAIDALAKFVPYAICDESTESYTNGLTDAYNLILQLPSAQPDLAQLLAYECGKASAEPEPFMVTIDHELTKDDVERLKQSMSNTPIVLFPSVQPEQRWIPCSERLPEDIAIVTVETKTFKHKYVCEAEWVPRWSKKAEYDNWEDCSEYNEDEDEYYVLEGWYERVHNWDEYSFVGIEDEVIAWMPLPEPYKEATT